MFIIFDSRCDSRLSHVNRSNSSDRRPNAKLAIYLSVDPKIEKTSKLEAEQERHIRCITSTRQTHKVFRFSISFRAQFNDRFAYICLSFLLVASFPSRKNIKYGHGSTETGSHIRRSPIMTSLMMMRKIDGSNLNLRRYGLRKKAHMLLHIAHRLVSVVIYLIAHSSITSRLSRRIPYCRKDSASRRLAESCCGHSKVSRLSHETFTISFDFLQFPFDPFDYNQRQRASYDNYLFARPVPISKLGQ